MLQNPAHKTVSLARKIALLFLTTLFLLLGTSLYLYSFIDTPKKTFAKLSETTPSSIPTAAQKNFSFSAKTYISNDHNFTFQYPSDWTVTITKEQEHFIAGSIVSPNNLLISFINGVPDTEKMCVENTDTDMGNEPLTAFGKPLILHYYGEKETGLISSAYVSEDITPCPSLAYFTIPEVIMRPNGESFQKVGSIKITYKDNPELAQQKFMSDELLTAKKIISTFSQITR